MQVKLIGIMLIPIIMVAQDPHLYPRIVLPGDGVGAAFWLLAPQIALVRIQRAEWTGPDLEITPPQKMVVRLVRVDAVVENVIRGDVEEGPRRFYFFAEHSVVQWLPHGPRVACARGAIYYFPQGRWRRVEDSGRCLRFWHTHSHRTPPQDL